MPLKKINILISLYFILLIKLSILESGVNILVILFSEPTYFELGVKEASQFSKMHSKTSLKMMEFQILGHSLKRTIDDVYF